MELEALPDDLVDDLLGQEESPGKREYPVPPQVGPLRHFDVSSRCASRGCGSPTFLKVRGIRRCTIHALRELNQMLVDLGVEK